MKIALRIATILFLFFSSMSGDDTSADIWRKIDDLEKQKPLLSETINYCNEQIPIAQKTKKDVDEYGQKMQEVVSSNIDKTLKSGALNTLLEVHGSINGGKLVEMGAWLVGKGIGIEMDKSSTFGGQSYTKQKIEGISKIQKNMTNELDKLYKISNSSDEAMTSYYNKYGKYADEFEIGDVGIFTQRMRLIVEQSSTSSQSLDELLENLSRTLEDTQRELNNVDQQIEMLKQQLEDLRKQDKNINIQLPKAPELSEKEENAAIIVPKKQPSISIPGLPLGCKEVYKDLEISIVITSTLSSIENNAQQSQNTMNEYISKRNEALSRYLEEAIKNIDEINKVEALSHKYRQYVLSGSDLANIKQGHYPQGATFAKFIAETTAWNHELMRIKAKKITSQKSLADSLIRAIPSSYDELISQEMANIGSLKYAHAHIIDECYIQKKSLIIANEQSPGSEIIDTIKGMKHSLDVEIQQNERLLEEMKTEHPKVVSQLERYFSKRRSEMREEMDFYEKRISKKEAYENQLIVIIDKLQSRYKNGNFTIVDGNGFKNYQLNVDVVSKENLCAPVREIKSILSSNNVQGIISLEKQIKGMLELSYIYSAPGLPSAAYFEYERDLKSIEVQHAQHTTKYIEAMNTYINSRSNLQSIDELTASNSFMQLGMFYPKSGFYELYQKLVKSSARIRSGLVNLRVEINGALILPKIHNEKDKELHEYYDHEIKEFKDNFGCLPLDYPLSRGIIEEFDALKVLLAKVKNRPTFLDGVSMFREVSALKVKVSNFTIDTENVAQYMITYTSIKDEHTKYHTLINETYKEDLLSSDKTALNRVLIEIDEMMLAHDNVMSKLQSGSQQKEVESLYVKFAEYYANKNLSGLMNLLSDQWMSSSDGTTLMDLENTLSNSFSIFNEIKCQIGSINIESAGMHKYRVNYTITIEGFNYENDIKHVEKSSVSEEVEFIDGKAKIVKTLNGKYWTTR
ncbi:MAG: hypothetical protein V2A75_03410 [Pseudomonadota bacterium]